MKQYGVNPPPTAPRPSNNVAPPDKVSCVTMGDKTFPLVESTEQVGQILGKRYDIAELVVNTSPEFLKDAWAEKAPDCPVCGEGFILRDGESGHEYCSECGTVLFTPEQQSQKYHYWLVSYVYSLPTGFGYGYRDVITTTHQFGMDSIRYVEETCGQDKIVILSVSYLGEMTQEEYQAEGETSE